MTIATLPECAPRKWIYFGCDKGIPLAAIISREWVEYQEACQRRLKARRRMWECNAHTELVNRNAIITRDNSTCQICGCLLSKEEVTLDHIIPISKGGEHTEVNLRVACRSCNSRKGNK